MSSYPSGHLCYVSLQCLHRRIGEPSYPSGHMCYVSLQCLHRRIREPSWAVWQLRRAKLFLLSSILTIERGVALVVNAERDMCTCAAATQNVRIVLLNGVQILHFCMLGTQLVLQPQVLPDTDSCALWPVLKCFLRSQRVRRRETRCIVFSQSLTPRVLRKAILNKVYRIHSLTHSHQECYVKRD